MKTKKSKMNPKTKKWLLIGGAAAVVLSGGFAARKQIADVLVALSEWLRPASVTKGESVTAQSYRVIDARRPGMEYAKVDGQAGSPIVFKVPVTGDFTRNLVQETGGLFAEIKPA